MKDPYMTDLCRKIDSLYPGSSERLERIDALPDSVSNGIVNILLEWACKAQNVGAITSARRLMRAIPPLWLSNVLHGAIDEVIDLRDEWEYRRLIELLKELKSELLAHYIRYGMASQNEEIREAAMDFNKD